MEIIAFNQYQSLLELQRKYFSNLIIYYNLNVQFKIIEMKIEYSPEINYINLYILIYKTV